ncbi:MAG: glycoside hydrolase family 32 protein [Spirochaetales bacterium]|nr:glycoside hydrolase family 32 protein [Spirochaetales bacterium]
MNDPNGCVFYKGVYHLYFQHHPHDNEWGPMHWGHAESADLIHWEEKDIALYPSKKLGMAFSGSAVVDDDNLSGFFPEGEGLLAYYTNHLEQEDGIPGLQQQSLAWSSNEGLTWNEYENNPIIKNPGLVDFRDPKVFYHELSKRWIMVLSGGYSVLFYSSDDLLLWEKSGEINIGNSFGVVECPDLFPVKTESGRLVWLLTVSFLSTMSPDLPTVRYFPGDFNGTTFTPFSGIKEGLVSDYGRDFYAAQSWSGIPQADGRKIWIGWCNHWEYSNQIPTQPWRGVMSIPRELFLDENEVIPVLKQLPVEEFKALRKSTESIRDINDDGFVLPLDPDLSHEFIIKVQKPAECDFIIFFNYLKKEKWKLEWHSKEALLELDRSSLVSSGFNNLFIKTSVVEVTDLKEGPSNQELDLRIILDRSIVEIFILGGKFVMTSQIFPSYPLVSLTVSTVCGGRIREFIHHTLDSIWLDK